ncbi:major facilitator superfamily transporter [Thozetella sp. PMI_491]|nr:major facilitator superfamily transporter [Thozetella sp. PMI_491]
MASLDADRDSHAPSGQPPSEAPVVLADDSEHPPPYSIYTTWEKRWIVMAAAMSAFFSPLTAQIYLPALTALAEDFHVSDSQINLTVTTYMIFQGVTPMFIGGLADTAGRRPAYLICFVVYIAANIGLALSPNYASLLVLRCLQSAGSSTTVALCQAVVADIITSAERGQFIGITTIPIMLAPSLGPVLGGIFSQYLSWRAIFWFLTIASTINMILLALFFPETCRKIVGDGSLRPHPAYKTCWQMIKDWRHRRAARMSGQKNALERTPSSATDRIAFRLTPPDLLGSLVLLFQKELGLVLGYSSILMGGFYAIATAMPSELHALYGFSDIVVGLMYLPMAAGSVVAALFMGRLINWNYQRHARALGLPVDKTRETDLTNFPIEKARLEIAMPLVGLSTAVILAWGWAMQYKAGVAVHCVLLFLMGLALIGANNATNTLIIDINPSKAGAAIAANNLTRCLIGAGASAAISPMINAMGSGWAFTLIGLLYLVFWPSMMLVMKYGIQWRAEFKAKEALRDERREGRRHISETTGGQEKE